VLGEGVTLAGPRRQPRREVGRDVVDVRLDRLPRVVAGDDELGEVLVEEVADDAGREVGLAVEQRRCRRRLRLRLDLAPLRLQAGDVAAQLVLAGALGCRTDDDAGALGTTCLRTLLSRERSVSGSLRLMPVIEPSGTYTRNRPARLTWLVSRAPFWPIGSFVTWTSTGSPDLSATSIRFGWPSRPAASQLTSPA
jgi:hypothetical protein